MLWCFTFIYQVREIRMVLWRFHRLVYDFPSHEICNSTHQTNWFNFYNSTTYPWIPFLMIGSCSGRCLSFPRAFLTCRMTCWPMVTPQLRNFPLVTGVNVTHLATRCLKYVSVCVNPSDEGTTAPPYAKLNSKSTGRSEEWSAAGTRSIGGLCTLTSILVDMS